MIRVKRVAGVVTVGPHALKYDHSGNLAGAVGRQVAIAKPAIAGALQRLVNCGGGVVSLNHALLPINGDTAALGRRAELRLRAPRAEVSHLRAEPIPFAPDRQQLVRDRTDLLGRHPRPCVGIARVGVNGRRQHVLHGPGPQFKHNLRAANIALHRPTDLARRQINALGRLEQNLATVGATDDPRGRRQDCIKVNIEGAEDQARVRHVVNVQRACAAHGVQKADVVRRTPLPILDRCGALLPAER